MVSESGWSSAIVERRKAIGMSRSELAAASGLSYPYISQLETGLRKPSRNAVGSIAQALGVDPLALEATVPSSNDAGIPMEMRERAFHMITGSAPHEALIDSLEIRSAEPPRSSRDDLIAQILDLVEEVEPEDRIELLVDVQKTAMERLVTRSNWKRR